MQRQPIDPDAKKEVLVQELNHVISHDRAAFDVCDAAASRLDATHARARIREIGEEHLRRINKLSRTVAELGGTPTHHKASLARGRDAIRQLSRDRSVIEAFLEAESDVRGVYESALDLRERLPRARPIIERAWQRQRMHADWFERQLSQLG